MMPVRERQARRWPAQIGLAVGLAVLMAALAAARPGFLTVANLVNLVRQVSINGILAVGVTFVLLTGGVDLSLGSVAALAGVVAAGLAHPGEHLLFWPLAAGILMGAVCGCLNGVMVTWGGVAPFIVTLGMMTAARGG